MFEISNAPRGVDAETAAGGPPPPTGKATAVVARLRKRFGFRNVGAVYVWALIVVVFAVWVPSTFLTTQTAKQILDNNAVVALLGLSLIVPLSARVFDLSIGLTASLSGVLSSYLVLHGVPVAAAVAAALAACLGVGLFNAFVVVTLGVDSFIATLATGALISAVMIMTTNGIPLTGAKLGGSFAAISQKTVAGITLPVVYYVVVAAVLWFVLEHTATGRRIYATGFNRESARLSGVPTERLRFMSLLVSASIAGVAGIVVAGTTSSGDPAAGNPYLLTAYAAAFVGATQLKGGRFNPWGTLIAVFLLGTGVTGLGLASAPSWATNAFTGGTLIIALAITGAEVRALRRGRGKAGH
jgi:ribose/xylose/arabinose/galactoside ABC-type transport system permease subunit